MKPHVQNYKLTSWSLMKFCNKTRFFLFYRQHDFGPWTHEFGWGTKEDLCTSQASDGSFSLVHWDRVSHLWFRFGFGKFPLKIRKRLFFSFWVNKISSGRVKAASASYLLRVKSLVGLGQGPSLVHKQPEKCKLSNINRANIKLSARALLVPV